MSAAAWSRWSRRTFLQVGAMTGAALVVGFDWTPRAAAQGAPEAPRPDPLHAWVRIGADGAVTLILAKSEMGQGVMTSLPMILAEELDLDFARVQVEQAVTDPRVYDHGTGGSGSVSGSYLPLRKAGAAARQMLVQAAAERWGVAPASCRTAAGTVLGPAGERSGYGELAVAAAKLPVPDLERVQLKDPAQFRLIGTSPPRLDIPGKVDGSARYGLDVQVPGLLVAVIARCPTFGGRPVRWNAVKAKAVPGVREVVEIPPVKGAFSRGGIAVVADGTWPALQGRAALAVEWDHGPHAKEGSAALRQQLAALVAREGKVVRDDSVGGAGASSPDTDPDTEKRAIEAVYELPFQAHAPMEPMTATVHVRADGAEAWLPSQGPQWARQMIAGVTGFKPEQVTVHTTFLGGGFGRRYHVDYAVEAAQVSQAVKAPVKVVWTREDDLQHGFYRPASLHHLRGTLDGEGRPLSWRHRMASTSIGAFWGRRRPPEASEIGGAVDLPYAIPRIRMEYLPADSAVPVMWWRSVEHSANAFVTECFLDELAAAAKVDPLALRLRLLGEARSLKIPADTESVLETRRLRQVLELAAEKSGWGKPLPAGRARGIACHFSFDSYVAEVAEVSVAAGRPRVHRVTCAVDCGRVIHPDGLRAQVEGAVAFALTAALKSAITVADGRVEQSNFHDYEMLRIAEMPEVEVHLVASDAPPTGMGEPGVPPLAPAVANAIFAATGRRVRRLPIRAEDLA